jgi:hypothetical protein
LGIPGSALDVDDESEDASELSSCEASDRGSAEVRFRPTVGALLLSCGELEGSAIEETEDLSSRDLPSVGECEGGKGRLKEKR